MLKTFLLFFSFITLSVGCTEKGDSGLSEKKIHSYDFSEDAFGPDTIHASYSVPCAYMQPVALACISNAKSFRVTPPEKKHLLDSAEFLLKQRIGCDSSKYRGYEVLAWYYKKIARPDLVLKVLRSMPEDLKSQISDTSHLLLTLEMKYEYWQGNYDRSKKLFLEYDSLLEQDNVLNTAGKKTIVDYLKKRKLFYDTGAVDAYLKQFSSEKWYDEVMTELDTFTKYSYFEVRDLKAERRLLGIDTNMFVEP